MKYVLSSGNSVVSEIIETEEFSNVSITSDWTKALQFDTIGEAMVKAILINKLLGTYYAVASY